MPQPDTNPTYHCTHPTSPHTATHQHSCTHAHRGRKSRSTETPPANTMGRSVQVIPSVIRPPVGTVGARAPVIRGGDHGGWLGGVPTPHCAWMRHGLMGWCVWLGVPVLPSFPVPCFA